jgi:hypothetical protein
MDDVSERLQDLLFFGLDHGIDGVREGSLIPFVVVDGPDGRGVHRIVDGTPDRIDLDGSVRRAVDFTRERMAQAPDVPMVLVYDAYLRLEDERFDAVFAEAVDQGDVRMVIAQRYRPKAFLKKFETIGNPGMLPLEMGRLSEAAD